MRKRKVIRKKRKQTEKGNTIKDILLKEAYSVIRHAYAPFSRFYVGASLLGSNGKVYTGVNVENASLGLTLCAEKAALAQAVSDGCRSFKAIVVTEKKKGIIPPCGACRQMFYEFSPKMKIAIQKGKTVSFIPLERLLPKAFSL